MIEQKYIRLSELTGKISLTLKEAFADQFFWVIADITSHSYKQLNDWHFFILAEKQDATDAYVAKVDAVAWKSGSTRIREFEKITGQRFKNDINVLVKVSVDYTPSYGLKLILHDIDPNFTIGLLEQQKQETLTRLLTECSGYIKKSGDKFITLNNQIKLNPVIQRIALVASDGTAGYEDFIHTLHSNGQNYRFDVDCYFTSVQGEGNAALVKQKLIEVYQSNKKYDALVIIRGGGSQTDFLIFETFILGQIIAKYPIPVITGIGHLRNETIVDMMANSPTNAPTKAAEFIIAHNRSFEDSLFQMQNTILIKAQQLFSFRFQLLASLNSSVVNKTRTFLSYFREVIGQSNQATVHLSRSVLFKRRTGLMEITSHILLKPGNIVNNRESDLRNLYSNLINYSRIFLQNNRGHIGHFITIFSMISPDSILKKGFAIVYKEGRITSTPDSIYPGDDITVLLAGTEITATVKSKIKSNGTEFKL